MQNLEEEVLKEGERFDDLERHNYKIIQNPEKFCFGMDAVLLSGFAVVKQGERVIDLGTGTGIIPILLRAKTLGRDFTGLEIQDEMAAWQSMGCRGTYRLLPAISRRLPRFLEHQFLMW